MGAKITEGGRDGKETKGKGDAGGSGGREGPEGHVGDEREELVMVMRRCNDSSVVRSEFALVRSVFISLSLSFS